MLIVLNISLLSYVKYVQTNMNKPWGEFYEYGNRGIYGKEFKTVWKPRLLTKPKEIDKEQICDVTS